MINAIQYFNSMQTANSQMIAVQELLKDSACKLEDLMEEDGVLQEFRDARPNVIAFFDNEKLDRLVAYVVADVATEEDARTKCKLPNVAAELLSSSVARVFEYFLQTREERLANVDRLLAPLRGTADEQPSVEQNLTRIGYIQKVIMALIASRPAILIPYLLADSAIVAGLLANCHSKSMHGLLLLLALGQSSLQLSGDGIPAKELEALRVNTLPARQNLLKAVLSACLQTALVAEAHDAHINLCNLASTLFVRDSPDHFAFLALFARDFLRRFLDELAAAFDAPTSRAFSVLCAFFEAAAKEANALGAEATESLGDLMALVAAPRGESVAANPKLVRLLESIRLLLKRRSLLPNFEAKAFADAPFAAALVRLVARNPQNNILHNQILKFWVFVLELGADELSNCHFTENAELWRLFDGVQLRRADNFSNARNRARVGYLGHLKQLFEALLRSPLVAKLERVAEFARFQSQFHTHERKAETFCLGDVDVGQIDAESETNFAFGVDELQSKYSAFLQAKPVERPTVVEEAPHAERIGAHGAEESPHVEAMLVEEEVAFFDSNYWKPVIDYNIEQLSLEMGFGAL